MKYPKTLPAAHESLLKKIIKTLSQDERIMAIGASGSYASDTMDEYSDLDLVVAIEPEHFSEVMAQRANIIDRVEGKISDFTGEHVGEPRLVIALFQPNLLHVDFKFVALPDTAERVDDVKVLWQRGTCLSSIYASSEPCYPQPNPQWIEDRFWTWLHYGAAKIARGEYFEALEFLSFLRTTVLSPLALKQNDLTPSGVRTIEMRLPEFADELKGTVALPEKNSLVTAFQVSVSIYIRLRASESVVINEQAQKHAMDYFEQELITELE